MMPKIKTAIIDPRVPLGKQYVDLTVDEVLEACKIYKDDRDFEKALGEYYNKLANQEGTD